MADSIASPEDALICAYEDAGDGFARALAWSDIARGPLAAPGVRRWVHLNRLNPAAAARLKAAGDLDEVAVDALLQEDTRPRAVRHGTGLIVNLHAGAEPEDMLAIRIWATPELIVSTRALPIRAIEDMRAAMEAADPPLAPGAFVARIAEALTRRMAPVIARLDDDLDAREEAGLENDAPASIGALSRLRRRILALKRFITPQRDALAALLSEGADFFDADDAACLRETLNETQRLAEALDLLKDRAQVLHEDGREKRAEILNDRLFVIAIVSVVFLPLGFLTGLFGANVGGVPWTEAGWGFLALCGALGLSAVFALALLKRARWF